MRSIIPKYFERTSPVGNSQTQRFERKFFITPENLSLAYPLLRQVCRLDREYPVGIVNSLYFDTPDLDQYLRSESGDFTKDKVRIRWYNEVLPGNTVVFLERKSRQGFASSKQRRQLVISSESLMTNNLSAGIIEKSLLLNTLAGFNYFPGKPLRPVIVIRYRRYRFNEMSYGIRVSFDYNISASPVAPELGRKELVVRLAGGVIEVKGPDLELPATLRRMKMLNTDWSRFSKYGNCISACLSEPGTVARSWPSGRMSRS